MSPVIKDVVPIREVGAAALTGAATSQSRELREFASFSKAIFILNVTAVSGSGASMTVTIQEYDPQSGTWADLPGTQFTAVTATGRQRIAFSQFGTNLRANYVRTGSSPSFTFTLTGIGSTE